MPGHRLNDSSRGLVYVDINTGYHYMDCEEISSKGRFIVCLESGYIIGYHKAKDIILDKVDVNKNVHIKLKTLQQCNTVETKDWIELMKLLEKFK